MHLSLDYKGSGQSGVGCHFIIPWQIKQISRDQRHSNKLQNYGPNCEQWNALQHKNVYLKMLHSGSILVNCVFNNTINHKVIVWSPTLHLHSLTLSVSWPLYLALMSGVWMMSRLVPVTVIGVYPLKEKKKGKKKRRFKKKKKRQLRLLWQMVIWIIYSLLSLCTQCKICTL